MTNLLLEVHQLPERTEMFRKIENVCSEIIGRHSAIVGDKWNNFWSSIQPILTADLVLNGVTPKFVPRVLTGNEKQRQWQKLAWFQCLTHLIYLICPCDSFSFQRMKTGMKGFRIDNIDDVKKINI